MQDRVGKTELATALAMKRPTEHRSREGVHLEKRVNSLAVKAVTAIQTRGLEPVLSIILKRVTPAAQIIPQPGSRAPSNLLLWLVVEGLLRQRLRRCRLCWKTQSEVHKHHCHAARADTGCLIAQWFGKMLLLNHPSMWGHSPASVTREAMWPLAL